MKRNTTTASHASLMKAFVLLLFPICINAQNIGYNENLHAEISVLGEEDIYTFGGNSGDIIMIRMRDDGGPVDACIQLIDKHDNVLAEHCRDGGIVNITDFALPYTGEYRIKAIDNNHNDTGAYGLSLHKLNQPLYARKLNCGADIRDTIFTTVGVNIYKIELVEGDVAEIQMRSRKHHFESIFYLYDASGNLVETSVREKSQLTSIYREFEKSGTYSLVVMDKGGNDKDYYGFSFQIVNKPDCADPISDCGSTETSQVTHLAEMDAFHFFGEEGKTYLFYLEAKNQSFESQLTFYDPEGIKLQEDVVNGKSLFTILPSLEQSGDYQVVVRDEHGNDASDYELSFSILELGCAQILDGCSPEMESRLFHGTSIELFAFKVEEQVPVTLSMKELSKPMEPMIYLLDSSGAMLDFDTHYKQAKIENAEVEPASYHFIVALDKGGNDPGDFVMSAEMNGINSLITSDLVGKDIKIKIGESGTETISPEAVLETIPTGCSISLSVAPNAFTCEHVGLNEVVVTLTKSNGEQKQCIATVEVVSDLKLVASECAQVFTDYAPQSCTTLSALASGGAGDYSYVWSHDEIGSNVEVCPTQTEIYEVTVFDKNQCSVTQEIKVSAENIICPDNGQKVKLCHRPPGNSENAQTLCISINAIDAHVLGGQEHEGCTVGPCGLDPCGSEEELNGLELRENDYGEIEEDVHVHINSNRKLIVYFGSGWINSNLNIQLVNQLGQRLWLESTNLIHPEWIAKSTLPDIHGIYFVHVYNETRSHILPVTIR